MKSIDDRAKTTARPRRGGKDFAPRGTVVAASGGDVDLTWKYLVQRFRHKAEGIFLLSPSVGNLDRHSTSD